MNPSEAHGSGVLILLGVAVFGGIINALLVKKVSIPQVLGYMICGIILGGSGFRIIKPQDIEHLAPVNLFCLAIIGFLVGGEIKFGTMRKYGKQFTAILLGEGLAAFLLVTIAVTTILYVVTGNIQIALAAGIVFGAIASATDPASTIAVLWEYRSAGILTTTITAIVALDDALAMTLYGFGSGIAQLMGQGDADIVGSILRIAFELFGSVAMGVVAGLILSFIVKKSSTIDTATVSLVGLLMVITGVADFYRMDVILAAMSAGITVANTTSFRYSALSGKVKAFSTTIYVLFFVLVGARLQLQSMPWWLWAIVGTYVIGRSVGKMVGSMVGARISHAGESVQKYSGMALLAQGGVAVGLSIMAAQKLQGVMITADLALGDVIVFGVTTTTFFVQLIGPLLVKVAIKRGGEIGRDVNEDDIAATLCLGDIPLTQGGSVLRSTSIHNIFKIFSKSKSDQLAIVDAQGKPSGCIGFKELRNLMLEGQTWNWLIAEDVANSPVALLQKTQSCKTALSTMDKFDVTELPVVEESGSFLGMVTRLQIKDSINHKMVENQLQQLA